jgi:hypothetical protein
MIMFDALIIVVSFVIGFLACYFYMTAGIDQDEE